MQEKLRDDLRDDGFRIRTSANAAPALSDSIERFSQFLALVGLCALLVGGVGVANAVQAHLDAKRPVIATLKSLGAGHGLVASVYLIQTMIASVIGVAIGLVLGGDHSAAWRAQRLRGFCRLKSIVACSRGHWRLRRHSDF